MNTDLLHFRFAVESDVDLYFRWVNDEAVRQSAYNTQPIRYDEHVKWFTSRVKSHTCTFYIFYSLENIPVGQVRIENFNSENTIDISVDKLYRGKSAGEVMLKMSGNDFFLKNPAAVIYAYVKEENIYSYKVFIKAGFKKKEDIIINNCKSHKLFITKNTMKSDRQ